jgi:uncharacterized protein YbjT (DUF2867 family)
VVSELLRRGYVVTALVRPPARRVSAAAQIVEGDLVEPRALSRLLDGQDGLLHIASLGFGHADGVVAAVRAARVPRAVFFSSTAIFTRLPAASKSVRIAAEERVRSLENTWTILRPTMIYGDVGDRNLSRLIRFISRFPVVPLPGGGHALVQPVHVEDVARAAVEALTRKESGGREYNLPGGEAAPLRELVRHVGTLLRRRLLLLPLPLGASATAAAVWHAVGLPPRISREQVLRLGEDKAFACEAARRDLGYDPRGFREGLAQEVAGLRAARLV